VFLLLSIVLSVFLLLSMEDLCYFGLDSFHCVTKSE
jgi:hypothetical protein